ncbi:hypothetical protein GCM10027280_19110 [Micromonospora polyrhachis]
MVDHRYGIAMVLPVSRTNMEAHLYMDLHPCTCGEFRFARKNAVIALEDGDLASRYTGECARCGQPREFVFRLPTEISMPLGGDAVSYGGDEPSQLIDPGQWLGVADAYASQVPGDFARLDGEERRRARAVLNRATAAVDEVLKFIPGDADEVPAATFTSERGRQAYAKEPGRFRRSRLAVVRDAYAGMAGQLA